MCETSMGNKVTHTSLAFSAEVNSSKIFSTFLSFFSFALNMAYPAGVSNKISIWFVRLQNTPNNLD